MIKDKKTTIGYHCPFCGSSILNRVDVFSMSNKMLKLKCVCRESELVLHVTRDDKIRITVPCIICPITHSFTISSSVFFEKDLFFMTCTFTAVGICFFGKGDQVIKAMKENEEELVKMFAAYDEYNEPNKDNQAYKESGFRKITAGKADEAPTIDEFFLPDGDYEDDDYYDDYDDYEYEDEYDDDDYDFSHIEDFDKFDDVYDFNSLIDPVNSQENAHIDWDSMFDAVLNGTASNNGNAGNMRLSDEKEGFEIYKNKNAEEKGITIDAGEKILLDRLKIKSPLIFEQILSTIYNFIDSKKVRCFCEKTDDFAGSLTLQDDKIILECKNCGAKREIKAKSPIDLEYFYDINTIYLDRD